MTSSARKRLHTFIESRRVQAFIIALILTGPPLRWRVSLDSRHPSF